MDLLTHRLAPSRLVYVASLVPGLLTAQGTPVVPARPMSFIAPPSAATAFVNVTVVPMDRERLLRHQIVVVRGDRIVAMGPVQRVPIPAGAVRIDGRGQFLIPGLADMHAHFPGLMFIMSGETKEAAFSDSGLQDAERRLFLEVANGVTTVRSMYGWTGIPVVRERAAQGTLLSPRIYAAAGPYDGGSYSIDTLVKLMTAAKVAGANFVKLHGESGADFENIVTAARRVGLPIAGHVPSLSPGSGATSVRLALAAGYRSIEHLTGYADGDPDSISADTLRALAEATRRAGVWNCPTLVNGEFPYHMFDAASVLAWHEGRAHRGPYPLRPSEFVNGELFRGLLGGDAFMDSIMRDTSPNAREALERIRKGQRLLRRSLQALHGAGAKLLLGTDDVTHDLSGYAVHQELEALVRDGGLTPYEALATGTRNVAEFLGTLDSTGTIAVGKRADLVLLPGNPLADIRQTAYPAGVMLAGRWLPRAELDDHLRTLIGVFRR